MIPADLGLSIDRRVVGSLVQSANRQGKMGAAPTLEELIAGVLARIQPASADYVTYPYTVANGFSQQIVPNDPNRVAMVLVSAYSTVVGTLPYYLFEGGQINPTATQTGMTLRAFLAPQNIPLVFSVAPTNAVTVIAAGGSSVSGVILCASQ